MFPRGLEIRQLQSTIALSRSLKESTNLFAALDEIERSDEGVGGSTRKDTTKRAGGVEFTTVKRDSSTSSSLDLVGIFRQFCETDER